jgi:hypothetical protein
LIQETFARREWNSQGSSRGSDLELLALPGAAGCQALFSKARIESPEEAAISKAVKARLAAEKTVNLTSVEVETNSR